MPYRRRPLPHFRRSVARNEKGESGSNFGGIAVLVVGGIALFGWLFGGSDVSDDAPKDEKEFVKIVQTAQETADGNDNEMKVAQARKTRNADLCDALPGNGSVSEWIGTVTDLDTTLGGDSGVLTLEMAEDIEVGTWNNGFSDLHDHTLIPTDSELYNDLASLEEGDEVVFSGKFVAHGDDCTRESSLTDYGGMTSPSFIFKFDSVKAK